MKIPYNFRQMTKDEQYRFIKYAAMNSHLVLPTENAANKKRQKEAK